MRKYLNWFLNGFAISFAIPTFLIIISWNAIPGDRLYGVKTGLEDIALNLTIKTPLGTFLSVRYTERRFGEANTLLSKKGSTLGYSLLVTEARESKTIIAGKKDKSQARDLVSKIEKYQTQISDKRIAIETGTISIPSSTAPTPTTAGIPTQPTNVPVATPTNIPNIPTSTPVVATPTTLPANPIVTAPPATTNTIVAESEDQILKKLNDTEKELQSIKEELERVAASQKLPGGVPGGLPTQPPLPERPALRTPIPNPASEAIEEAQPDLTPTSDPIPTTTPIETDAAILPTP